jgi:hypothetical protein
MPPNLFQSKLLFPDACWRPDIISGALFLYFHKETITFPLHPSVSTFLTRADPFDFFSFAESRAPSWLPKLATFREIWNQYRMSLQKTSEILKPLRGNSFKTIMLSYDRGKHGWESAEDIIASSSLPFSEIAKLIDPYSAADELFSHFFSGNSLRFMRHTGQMRNCEFWLLSKRGLKGLSLVMLIGRHFTNTQTSYSARRNWIKSSRPLTCFDFHFYRLSLRCSSVMHIW